MAERIKTGVVGGVIFLLFLYVGGIYFSMFMMLLALIGYHELVKMVKVKTISFLSMVGYLFILVIFTQNMLLGEGISSQVDTYTFLIVSFILMMLGMLFSKNKLAIDKVSILFMGLLYIGIGFLSFTQIRLEEGLGTIAVIVLLIWITDSGAYFVGRKIGKRKLMESVSPNKSIEGFVGGVVLASLFGLVIFLTTEVFNSLLQALCIVFVVSIFGQLGDLVQSAMKRYFQVKDSGKILPGHGGILDRFDSLLFVCLILFIILKL